MPTLVAEFDREWEIVLDRVKQSKDLADLHELLTKWRHTVSMEMRCANVCADRAEQVHKLRRLLGAPQ
jgi:hypothetical protein